MGEPAATPTYHRPAADSTTGCRVWRAGFLIPRFFAALSSRPSILARVNQPPRDDWRDHRLPQAPGSCWVLLVNSSGSSHAFPAAAGFVLPLAGSRNASHDARLPRGLDRSRRQVRALLVKVSVASRVTPGAFTWRRVPGIDQWDLSSWDLDGRSAWPSLASGLILAVHGARPIPGLEYRRMADNRTGSSMWTLDGLKSKLDLAIEFGVRTFFVPAGSDRQGGCYLATSPASTWPS